MRNLARAIGAACAVVLLALPAAGLAAEESGATQGGADGKGHVSDNLKSPLSQKQDLLREKALNMKLQGKVAANAKVGQVAKGQYVELAREGEDSIWTVLAEFGTQPATHNHGSVAVPNNINHGGLPGPLHNQIPQPDRSLDNTTIWAPDFSRAHYLDLLFDDAPGQISMRNFYKEQSNNVYAVNGDVTDWVQVPFNEAAYGSNYCGSIICTRDIRRLIEDELAAWVTKASATMTPTQIHDYLARFDKWDRNDFDHDSNFDEPDGYIDHFQSIHAGEGEETGGGAQGTNAIWSHRSYVNFGAPVGPPNNQAGGVQIGTTGFWIGDYTIEPENGGVGVFSHEYAHDLGLPDEYDTSGNTGGAENATGWWTIMSQGSYGTDGKEDLGSKPVGFNAWDKFQLGWLNYEVAVAGAKSEHKLGPSVFNTKQAQGLFVILPPSANPTTTVLGDPPVGDNAWYSTAGNNLDVTMTHDVTLPNSAGPISLSMQAWYENETCWDYAYVRVSADGGATYTNVHTSVSDSGNENGQNFGEGITGISGAAKQCDAAHGNPAWVPVTADLSAYKGKAIKLQFRYWTDGAAVGRGFEFDDLAITADGATVFADGAESSPNGWDLKGFRTTTGADTLFDNHYYVVENRQYAGNYDTSLQTGPYQFGFLDQLTKQDLVEHFPYQDGILVWYWDTHWGDNNVGDHPGQGLILPVDARPTPLHWADGTLVRPRIQSFDATFGLTPTDPIALHKNSVLSLSVPSQAPISVFDDMSSYWSLTDAHGQHGNDAAGDHYRVGWNSVDVPHTGTQVVVRSQTPGGFAQIEVRPSK